MGRTASLILLIAAVVGLIGALINGDWLIVAGFSVVATFAGVRLIRMGRGAG